LWFNPGLLEMDKNVTAGIANKEILQGDAAPGLALYDQWKSRRAAILEKGQLPSFRIAVATDAPTTVETKVPIETVSIVVNVSRARGRRFGSLVHAVVMDADMDCDSVMLERLARAHGFRLDSSEDEIGSAVEVAGAMLKHPILKAAAQAAIAHREYPFVYKNDDGTITEGNVDLVYQLANEWIIVDFKTGPSDRKEYRKQVDVYARAFEPTSVRAILFEVI
jgi:ATP-dependent exoDNAse (exonuclease V) beta subunit